MGSKGNWCRCLALVCAVFVAREAAAHDCPDALRKAKEAIEETCEDRTPFTSVSRCEKFDGFLECVYEVLAEVSPVTDKECGISKSILREFKHVDKYCIGFRDGMERCDSPPECPVVEPCPMPSPDEKPDEEPKDEPTPKPTVSDDHDDNNDNDHDDGKDDGKDDDKDDRFGECFCETAPSHGHYVSCVIRVAKHLTDEKLLHRKFARLLIRKAARSDCGKPNGSHDNGDKDDERNEKERDGRAGSKKVKKVKKVRR